MSPLLVVTLALGAQLQLSEDEAVRRALEVAPELEVELRDLDVAKAARARALSLENPSLRVRHNQVSAPREGFPLDGAQVHLRWKPPALERFGARQARDDKRVALAALRLKRKEQRLAAQVRALFAEVEALERRRAIAAEAVGLAERVQALSAKKLENAVGTRLEDGLARLDVLDARADQAEVESRLREARRRLRALVGLHDDEAFTLAPRASRCRAPSAAAAALAERAREVSLGLEEDRLILEELDAEARRTALDNVPWLDFVQAGWVFGDNNDPDSLGLRVGVTLPVFNWRLGELRELRSEKARALARLEQRRRALRLDVADAVAELSSLVELVALHDAAEGEVLQPAAADTERALELGEANALELALLRARLLRARRAALTAHLDCERAAIRLEELVGAPAPS